MHRLVSIPKLALQRELRSWLCACDLSKSDCLGRLQMTESWHRVRSNDDADVWFCLREIYDSLAICVSNRSQAPRRVVVDASRSVGWTLLCGPRSRITEHCAEEVVPSGTTSVVSVLNGQDSLQADLHVSVSSFEHQAHVLDSAGVPGADVELRKSADASNDVAIWLKNRKR